MRPRLGKGVIVEENVQFGENVVIWNYVVIGSNTRIGDGTCVGSFCDIGKDVVIGRNSNVQAHVTISNGCKIGDDVFIAPNSSFLNDKYPKSGVLTPVIVKDNAVLGGGVTILPGVRVEEGSVVGGAVLNTNNFRLSSVVPALNIYLIINKYVVPYR